MIESKILENWGLFQLEIESVRNNYVQYSLIDENNNIEIICLIELRNKNIHLKKEYFKNLIETAYLIRILDLNSKDVIFEKNNK